MGLHCVRDTEYSCTLLPGHFTSCTQGCTSASRPQHASRQNATPSPGTWSHRHHHIRRIHHIPLMVQSTRLPTFTRLFVSAFHSMILD